MNIKNFKKFAKKPCNFQSNENKEKRLAILLCKVYIMHKLII